MSGKVLIAGLLWISLVSVAAGQSGIRDSSISFTFLKVGYTLQKPGGDLDERFGVSSMVGGDLLRKSRNNMLYGISGGFIFGNDVKQPELLSGISTSTGQIIGVDGLFADVRLFQRGYHISLSVGKIFNLFGPNPNSGIVIIGGPGFIQHKIRIETIGNTTPQLEDDYLKGYDHLTNGFEMREFIGYMYFGNKQLLNFFGGFEFIQGFTKNRRDYNFDTPGKEEGSRTDLLWGLRIGWMLPFYKKKPDDFYYY